MKSFYQLLFNSLLVTMTIYFVWFAVTYWAYIETRSVLATSFIGGIYLVTTSLSGFWFGSIVDHNKKKDAMQIANIASLVFFLLGFAFFLFFPESSFTSVSSVALWIVVILLLFGSIVGNIRTIALPTVTTILVKENVRDRANGMSGTMMGFSFALSSVASGVVLGFAGLFWVLVSAIVLLIIASIHLIFINIPEKEILHIDGVPKNIDIKGTIAAIKVIPGLFPLIFFTTFNNFLGGVFMALMDAYGLSLMSVQAWGILWGILSFGFIAGGLYIAKKGLGSDLVRRLFVVNGILWTVCIIFPLQASIPLLAFGMLVYMFFMPFIEAIEQTIIQKVVPQERQGRVFGFAQSVEQAASPLTAFLIGPFAAFIFIPYMTTGAGVELIGSWFGTGQGRGIALVFIATGFIGLFVTLIAMHSPAYKLLSERYHRK